MLMAVPNAAASSLPGTCLLTASAEALDSHTSPPRGGSKAYYWFTPNPNPVTLKPKPSCMRCRSPLSLPSATQGHFSTLTLPLTQRGSKARGSTAGPPQAPNPEPSSLVQEPLLPALGHAELGLGLPQLQRPVHERGHRQVGGPQPVGGCAAGAPAQPHARLRGRWGPGVQRESPHSYFECLLGVASGCQTVGKLCWVSEVGFLYPSSAAPCTPAWAVGTRCTA